MAVLEHLEEERAYTRRAQELLLMYIEQSEKLAEKHSQAIREIIADAWENLRMRPTQLSPLELDQLSMEIDSFALRRSFLADAAGRYRRMLMNPFFARIDFVEEGQKSADRIVIGLYNLPDKNGDIVVHDWRAPICSLYYDSVPGPVSYVAPAGTISGEMTLKRQYKMENGVLTFYADTHLNIDDDMLLDILSRGTARHMRQIVASIQKEQNAAIRADADDVLCVVGGAGSGKTSVALHRAAYLMYRSRDSLTSSRIQIISPSSVFGEYISTVLPELGEENIRSRTMTEIVSDILQREIEEPIDRVKKLLAPEGAGRVKALEYKSGEKCLSDIEKYIESFSVFGPDFMSIWGDGRPFLRREELRKLYTNEFTFLTPAQRLENVRQAVENRVGQTERNLATRYEQELAGRYSGNRLKMVARMAAAQYMRPIKEQVKKALDITPESLLISALRFSPREYKDRIRENAASGLTWWEDGVCMAYLLVRLGFVKPDKGVYHLIIDEAQDYSPIALRLLKAYCPNAKITILGDPLQRTCPGMGECDPKKWGRYLGSEGARMMTLTHCYRSSMPIARLCNAILPNNKYLQPVGRDGELPEVAVISDDRIKDALARFRAAGFNSIAVITRTPGEAVALGKKLDNVYRLDGGDRDKLYETGDTVIGCFQAMKGMEFDAVIVAWGDCEVTDDERRRLYTSVSRALHAVSLFAPESVIKELGIIT